MMPALYHFDGSVISGSSRAGLIGSNTLAGKQLLIGRHAAGTDHVGKIFFGAPLREQALAHLGAAACDRRNFDLGIFFLKLR